MGRLTPVSGGRSRHVNNAAMGMQHRNQTGRYNAAQASTVEHIRTRRAIEGAIAEQTTGAAGRFDLSSGRLSGSVAGCTILAIMALSLVPGAQGAPAPTLPQGQPSQNSPPPTTDPFQGPVGQTSQSGTTSATPPASPNPPMPTPTPEPSAASQSTYERQGARPKRSAHRQERHRTSTANPAAPQPETPSPREPSAEKVEWIVDRRPEPAAIKDGRLLHGAADTRHLAYITHGGHSCSGTVVGERTVMTAQHCVLKNGLQFEGFRDLSGFKVCLPHGNRNHCNDRNTHHVKRAFVVNKYFKGHDYHRHAPVDHPAVNDMTILELTDDIPDYVAHQDEYPSVPNSNTFKEIAKSCHSRSRHGSNPPARFFVQGFGQTESGHPSPIAKEAEMICEKSQPNFRLQEKTGNVLSGDSGGPVLAEYEGDRFLVGDITHSGEGSALGATVERNRRFIKAVVNEGGVDTPVVGCIEAAQRRTPSGQLLVTITNNCPEPVEAICALGDYPNKDVYKKLLAAGARHSFVTDKGVVTVHGILKENSDLTTHVMSQTFQQHSAREFDRLYLVQIQQGWGGAVEVTLDNLQLALQNRVEEGSESELVLAGFIAKALPLFEGAFLSSCNDPELLNRLERYKTLLASRTP